MEMFMRIGLGIFLFIALLGILFLIINSLLGEDVDRATKESFNILAGIINDDLLKRSAPLSKFPTTLHVGGDAAILGWSEGEDEIAFERVISKAHGNAVTSEKLDEAFPRPRECGSEACICLIVNIAEASDPGLNDQSGVDAAFEGQIEGCRKLGETGLYYISSTKANPVTKGYDLPEQFSFSKENINKLHIRQEPNLDGYTKQTELKNLKLKPLILSQLSQTTIKIWRYKDNKKNVIIIEDGGASSQIQSALGVSQARRTP